VEHPRSFPIPEGIEYGLWDAWLKRLLPIPLKTAKNLFSHVFVGTLGQQPAMRLVHRQPLPREQVAKNRSLGRFGFGVGAAPARFDQRLFAELILPISLMVR
jgi:hypothetical protein